MQSKTRLQITPRRRCRTPEPGIGRERTGMRHFNPLVIRMTDPAMQAPCRLRRKRHPQAFQRQV
ncbi:MAG: hypothetical protein F4Y85_14425 [Gammaproteobacteria bacterium]|nr:hypothetical protein [Gammaproteobacteria bacterium]